MPLHETYGIPAARVLAFLDRLEKEQVNMHGFLLSRSGSIAAEGYWQPFGPEIPHRMFSVSKSMTSLAVGILLGRGRLSLKDRIIAYFPEFLPEKVPGPLARLTIRDMLRMATCHAATTYRPGTDRNWAQTFFTVPPTHEPGAVFAYDTSCSQVLAALLEKLTGMPLLTFLEGELFGPIGATGPKRWLKDPSGTSQGGTGLLMTLRDLGKVAAFMMGDGDGIVPKAYLNAATALQMDTPLRDNPEERCGYGYQFWRTRRGFSMYGLGGQLAVCVPELSLALCTIADTQLDPYGVQRIYDAFFEEIVPYVRDGLAQDEASGHLLSERLAGLVVRPVPSDPAFAADTGSLYRIQPAAAPWKALRLDPGALCLFDGADWKLLSFGMGKLASGLFPGGQEPCIASGGWIAPGTLRIVCHVIGDTPCGADLLLVFHGDFVTLQMKRVYDPITEGFEGILSGYRGEQTDGSTGENHA